MLIITTLAEYQTRFWCEIGATLRSRGQSVRFLSFDSRSSEMLAAAGFDFVDATRSACRAALGEQDPVEVCERFGMSRLGFWVTHEKFAFGVRDTAALLRKLAGTLLVADEAIGSVPPGAHPILMQELGGFLSVIGSHFAARRRGAPSWFIEPSFFRGRQLFLEGDIVARKLPGDARAPVDGPVAAYLDDTLQRSAIVIPKKDQHLYTSAFRKVVNLRNLKRLGEKLADKYMFGKEQEFGHVGSHVSTHARMIAASRKLSGQYTALDELPPLVYYPLHVPGDMALTLRSPEFLDQVATIDYLCRIAPLGHVVAVKEHPAMIGAMGARPLLALKRRYDNFRIIPPTTNNFDVLRRAAAVVTVNSKSGAEAGLLGKRVIVLGDAFYRNAPFALAIGGFADLEEALRSVLEESFPAPPPEDVRGYFAALWRETRPGELYVSDSANAGLFADTILATVKEKIPA